jgi:GalNAc-alpha-(1->4)-GalNAc-alpha-(1->3)-diNAcBac-PP-undecaprenol alpha-1,4-N-acetyl-D-galactosaminyltransferase
MRITLVIPSLERGGAERVMSILANSWAEQGRDVTLLTLNRGGVPAYPLDPSVKLRNLGLPGEAASHFVSAVWRQVGRIRAIRRAIRESPPDLIISFLERTNILTLAATRWLDVPVIVSERADPALYDIGRMWQILRRLAYRFADALVCQTSSALDWFQKRIEVRGWVIPNPVVLPSESAGLDHGWDKDGGGLTIVAMGRLISQKGFDLLLDAFSQIAGRYADWALVILGDGPDRNQLLAQVDTLKLAERVHFAGAVSNPFAVLRAADLFVLSSRFEGFPNSLCEAMACGVAVVSFDCPSGPAEIIRHEVDGILVPPQNAPALAAALERLMKDPEERKRLGARGPEVLTRFSREKVLVLWEQLFQELRSATQGTSGENQRRTTEARRQGQISNKL